MSVQTAPRSTSSNPAFAFSAIRRGRADTLPTEGKREATVTIEGTALKTLILVGLLVASAATVWLTLMPSPVALKAGASISPVLVPLLIGSLIGGFVLSLVTIFNPRTAPVTAPLYSLVEGVLIGAISAIFEYAFPGIVFQATAATIGVFGTVLALYASRVIKVTETFKAVLFASMLAILFAYLATALLRLFGVPMLFMHDSGPISIGISVVVCIVASLMLAWDFQDVVDAKNAEAPRWYEWYLGFGLMLTLIWLYLEILKLLAKLRSSD